MMMPDFHPRLIRGFPASNLFSCGKKKEAARWDSSRICFCPIVFVLLGALAATGVLDAQEPPKKNTTQDSGLVLRQTVRRVRVDVVVTDAQGHLVTGLQASDFRVADEVEIRWPSGTVQILKNVAADRIVPVNEPR